MAKISAVDFANNVERNRRSLRQHCLANGKDVLESETLDNVVAINNGISASTPDGKFKVEFKDLDGNYFAPTQYVNAGGSVVLPIGHPELDSEFLEFVEWTASGDLTNVQDNLVCLPVYQTKVNAVANQRPTILKCYFDENTLSPTLQIGSTHTNTYVNWGDGSEAQQVTSSTISHTYASAGLYSITIYGDNYNVGGNSSAGVFTNSSYQYALLKAYLGEKVTSIGGNAFRYCSSLTSITIPSSVTSISSSAFYNCYSLTSITIPSSVTRIGSQAFYSCYSLTPITIPSSVTSIGDYAFQYCSSLTSITIPSSVTSIGGYAFQYCYSLQSVTIPSSVTSIGDYAFQYCSSLTSITIPSSVTSIGNYAFDNCSSITDFVLYEDFNISGISLYSCALSDESLIDIANKLKDNTGTTAKTISFSPGKHRTRMNTIYLDANGARVPYGTAGAVSILAFIQNKNWTVSFS